MIFRPRLVLNKHSVLVFLASLLVSAMSLAYGHSGHIAVAHPVKAITIDGKLSDWPKNVRTYPVTNVAYGDKPGNDADLSAHFRVGYNVEQRCLYVAVEVADDSTVIDSSPDANWDTQDGCDIYVDGIHLRDRSAMAQYSRFGDTNHDFGSADFDDIEIAVIRLGSKSVYEWRVDLGREMISNRSFGFEVAVSDKDTDGSYSWAAWSPGTQKLKSQNRCGDVLILQPDTPFGEVAGKVQWHEPLQKALPQRVQLRSRKYPRLLIGATVDSTGAYAAKVPAGSYSIQAADTLEVRIEDSIVEVDVEANEPVVADLLSVAPRPKPGLIGETGVLHRFESVDPMEIERFVRAYMEYYQVPGLSMALVKDGKVVYRGAFGVKNVATREKVDHNTVFNAASMTKVVFAYLVNRLVERGVLDLDTPLHKYLPFEEIAHDERYKRITARFVLNHSSGFPNWFSGEPEITFDPGTGFGYSGIGFVYLGNVVSHLTGKKIETLIQEEVFAPMGIRDGSLVWNDRFEKLAASPHPDSISPTSRWRPSEPNVASSLHISAANYAKFLVALMNGEGLSKETLREMLRPQNSIPREEWGLKPSEKAAFGLGIVVGESPIGKWYSHSGNNPGFTSTFEVHDNGSIGYVFLVNNQQAHNLNKDLRAFLVTGKAGVESPAGK